MTQHWTTIKVKREKRFYAVLPLLLIPFLTVAFWALGGGRYKRAQETSKSVGINANLPAPLLSREPKDKLAYYEAAEKKAGKLNELIKGDPFYDNSAPMSPGGNSFTNVQDRELLRPGALYKQRSGDPDEMEKKVNQKLQQLENEINKPDQQMRHYREDDNSNQKASMSPYINSKTKQIDSAETDPELSQLDGMLNKILDIQYPERVTSLLRTQSLEKKNVAFPVQTNKKEVQVSLLAGHRTVDSTKHIQKAKFYGLPDDAFQKNALQSNIKAIVEEPQLVTDGAFVKLRLCTDVVVAGEAIRSGQMVYGIASFKGERMTVKIKGIQFQETLLPVDLNVFDMDAIEGIYIPGLISRDAMKQSADNALRSVMLNSLNPSVGVQAASAGIEAAKNLVGKKVKQVKVTLKPGHQVLLCNDKK